MKRAAMLVVIIFAVSTAVFAEGRERAVSRQTFKWHEVDASNPFDASLIDAPASGLPARSQNLYTVEPVVWHVHAFTVAGRPYSDPTWLAAHDRYHDGVFDVLVFRGRASFECETQRFTLTATPGADVDVVLNMSSFNGGDSIMLEQWPGYDVEIYATDATGKRTDWIGWSWTNAAAIPRFQAAWTRCQ